VTNAPLSDRALGRTLEAAPVSIIDIGSNSVRLVAYEGAVRAPTPLFNEKILCGLGRSVATSGRLGAESIDRALQALRRFRVINEQQLGVKTCKVIATAAVRDALDGQDFIARAEEACGCAIDVLSGEREADLAAKGVRMGFRVSDGVAGDLGGGSLELVDIVGEERGEATTLPLGGLRLIDLSGDKLEKACEFAGERLAEVGWLEKGRGRTFFAVGGTWRALARLHMEQADYPLRVMHGYAITTRDALAFCEQIRRARKLTSFLGIESVSKPRREVLPYGAAVLERLLTRMQPSEVVFSVFGIREGLLFELLDAQERSRDPLLSFCDRLASRFSRCAEQGHELAQWSDAIFAESGPRESEEEKRLRHAACIISDISWFAHPDYRGERSLDEIALAGLTGIDHPGRIFLALAVYFRHTGEGGGSGGEHLSSRLQRLVPRRMLKRARILGAAIRAGHMLSIGRSGTLGRTRLSYEDGAIVLSIPEDLADLNGERLRRRFAGLAGLLGSEPVIRVG
jgi:exopolyphosphatase/guanosine-5'-triphosphate,3'-diphosphate pyrophosphatase